MSHVEGVDEIHQRPWHTTSSKAGGIPPNMNPIENNQGNFKTEATARVVHQQAEAYQLLDTNLRDSTDKTCKKLEETMPTQVQQ